MTLLLKMLVNIISKETSKTTFENNPIRYFDTFTSFREFLLKILEDNVQAMAKDHDDGLFSMSRMQEKELENGKRIVNSYLKIALDSAVIPKLKNKLSKINSI